MKKDNKSPSFFSLLTPIYWPVWLVAGVLWLLVQLPFRWRLAIGRGIGALLCRCAKKLREVTRINIETCFPEMNEAEQKQLLKKNFGSVGIAIMEMAMGWWLPDWRLRSLVTLHGEGNIFKEIKKGRGVIALSPHFTSLELVGRLAAIAGLSFAVTYRPHKKVVISNLHSYFRRRIYARYLSRNNIRSTVRTLKEGMTVWYAHDIDPGEKHGVFVPFFGIQTASITAVSRLAALTDAAVIPLGFYRRDDNSGYDMHFEPALDDFPKDDLIEDTARINAVLERLIRKAPDQYIWQYKRFKTRPPGESRIY
jgi:KDO2-lipid IV(A) lauroyltransferase